MIIVRGQDGEEVERMLATDPFVMARVAEYEVISFAARVFPEEMADLLD